LAACADCCRRRIVAAVAVGAGAFAAADSGEREGRAAVGFAYIGCACEGRRGPPFEASSTATAHATVAPTIGLLPSENTGNFALSEFASSMPKKPYSMRNSGLLDNDISKIYFQLFRRFSYIFRLIVVNPLSIFEGWKR